MHVFQRLINIAESKQLVGEITIYDQFMIPRRWGLRDPEVVLTLHVSLTRSLVDVKMGLSNPRNQQQIESAPTYDANLGTTKFWDHFKVLAGYPVLV